MGEKSKGRSGLTHSTTRFPRIVENILWVFEGFRDSYDDGCRPNLLLRPETFLFHFAQYLHDIFYDIYSTPSSFLGCKILSGDAYGASLVANELQEMDWKI